MLASWLMSYQDTCPDPALLAYDALTEPERRLPRFFIWIGAFVAIEQVVHALTLALGARRLPFGVRTQPFRFPTGLALAWVVFTAMSIVLVALTFRSNAAVLAKTVHVVIEGLFLVLLSAAFGYRVFGAIAGFFLLTGLLMVLALPCSETILYAASSGLVLDAINFLAFAWFGLTRPDDRQLWLLIWGFGWHAMYLLTMLGVMRWYELTAHSKIAWRICGLYFNVVASELLLAASRRELRVAAGGLVRLKEWVAEHDEAELADDPLCLWTVDGVRLLGPPPPEHEVRTASAFRPGRTAFTLRALPKAVGVLVPLLGSEVRYVRTDATVTRLEYSVLCAYGWIRPTIVRGVNRSPAERALVISWGMVRAVYWTLMIAYALVAAAFP